MRAGQRGAAGHRADGLGLRDELRARQPAAGSTRSARGHEPDRRTGHAHDVVDPHARASRASARPRQASLRRRAP
ncbi:MAG: hypothetical protein MZW92_28740 [Comamonadaceae bacterium]|nr:hypothetical protein [Comamonadaceae bacterium]